jgi:hypothetical protein
MQLAELELRLTGISLLEVRTLDWVRKLGQVLTGFLDSVTWIKYANF